MTHTRYPRKDTGRYGEEASCVYLARKGFEIVDRNVSWKTGEIDIVAKNKDVLHIIEVKSDVVTDFIPKDSADEYQAFMNLHSKKIRKVIRTGEWYVEKSGWEGEWQVDALFVRIRARDRVVRVEYVGQIL
jgi:putative endonuclease